MSAAIEALVVRTKAGDRVAAEALVAAIQDDVYRLAFRTLGMRAEAEDATQEILLQALTHLSEFRAESAFRTWLWRIAVRHLLRWKKGQREEIASFEMIESLVAKGHANPSMPAIAEPEIALLAEEVRLSCTQGMVLSIPRDERISWILAEVFELSGEDAAEVLEVNVAAHRKRLSRAREKLGAWMGKQCGLANPANACRCRRQIPVATSVGVVDASDIQYATHPRSATRKHALAIAAEATEIEAAAHALRGHPDYTAPDSVLARIRAIIDSGRYQVFDA